jgi:hypothetical protein
LACNLSQNCLGESVAKLLSDLIQQLFVTCHEHIGLTRYHCRQNRQVILILNFDRRKLAGLRKHSILLYQGKKLINEIRCHTELGVKDALQFAQHLFRVQKLV